MIWPMMVLIVFGGIGFLTLEEMNARWKARHTERRFRLSLHSRIVLVSTAGLLLGGWLLYALLEWQGVLGGMSIPGRVENALFMSVTATILPERDTG